MMGSEKNENRGKGSIRGGFLLPVGRMANGEVIGWDRSRRGKLRRRLKIFFGQG